MASHKYLLPLSQPTLHPFNSGKSKYVGNATKRMLHKINVLNTDKRFFEFTNFWRTDVRIKGGSRGGAEHSGHLNSRICQRHYQKEVQSK